MLKKNISLAPHSNLRIGGTAEYFFEAKNVVDLKRAILTAQKLSKPIFILGGGTNILFADKDFKGVVIKPNIRTLERRGNKIRVGAGISMAQLLNYSVRNSLSGLEWAGGLPGTFGGALYGNAGAFGGEIKDAVINVMSLDISGKKPKVIRRNVRQCGFGYRTSLFKRKGQEIILEATLALKPGSEKLIKRAIVEKIKYRKERQPLDYPNIGSIFRNVDLKRVPPSRHAVFAHVIKTDPFPVIPAAYLIAEAGLKGIASGGAIISPKHPNFIVNVLNAEADDMMRLINLVKIKVSEKFDILLEEEVIVV